MIYEQPKIRALGDCYLSLSFADTIHLSANFRLQALAGELRRAELPGVVEVVPNIRDLAVVYDRTRTSFEQLSEAVTGLLQDVRIPEQVSSRLFRIPIWYDDPWSQAIAKKYQVPNNLEFVAEQNGLTPQQVIEHHTGCQFWVAAVGFVPGCFWSIPLDMSLSLTAPKYQSPRDFTPPRTLALAGLTTTIYPYAGAGGYQCIGRCPIDIYQYNPSPDGINADLFPEDGIMIRPGDRHQYYAVDALQYEDIRERVLAGTYRYEVKEEEVSLDS